MKNHSRIFDLIYYLILIITSSVASILLNQIGQENSNHRDNNHNHHRETTLTLLPQLLMLLQYCLWWLTNLLLLLIIIIRFDQFSLFHNIWTRGFLIDMNGIKEWVRSINQSYESWWNKNSQLRPAEENGKKKGLHLLLAWKTRQKKKKQKTGDDWRQLPTWLPRPRTLTCLRTGT